ncbi:YjdF family protein [Paenibacillus sp. MBLB4367]|uniref:YjdF family protein n=1 Tax=Paenibacillus sp. MBLB4367 TaxID=3384767 RepID=UPI0039083AF5
MKLTVYFAGDFWVGIVEEQADGKLRACRHIFGAEPHDAEVLEFVERQMLHCLEATSQSVAHADTARRSINSKRLARQAAAEMARSGVSTYAQEALKSELEHRKRIRKSETREERELLRERKREIARQKAKAKHRGR